MVLRGLVSTVGTHLATKVSTYLDESLFPITQRSLSANSETDFTGTFDTMSGIGMVLMVIPFIVWYLCAKKQYKHYLKQSTLRLQIISVRLSMFLPAYAFWMWISLISPDVGVLLEFATAVTEAMSFWGFFALLVENFGGPDNTIVILSNSYHSPCFCCQSNHKAFYDRLHWALKYVLWLRCPLVVILIGFELVEQRAAIIILSLISVAILANAFVSLIIFFHAVYEQAKNIGGLAKLILLKASVVLIVAQGLIVQGICIAGDTRLTDDEAYTSRGKTFRVYYLLVLVEFTVVSILYYYAFALEMVPSAATIDKFNRMGKDPHQRPDLTFGDFLHQACIRVDDVFYHLRPKEGPTDSIIEKGSSAMVSKNPLQGHREL